MALEPPHKYSAQQFLEALQLTGRLLLKRGERFDIVVIGGANLALQQLFDRLTVDVVAVRSDDNAEFSCANPLPAPLEAVVTDVAEIMRLPRRWMNGAASSDFALGLPTGYETRLHVMEYDGLVVSFADRADIVAWKLQAAVDNFGIQNRHLEDLARLYPSTAEVSAARSWFATVEGPDSGFWRNLESILEGLNHG